MKNNAKEKINKWDDENDEESNNDTEDDSKFLNNSR